MSAPAINEVLAMLDDLNASGGIGYDDYSRLHDAVAGIDSAAPELFPGTLDALNELTIRPAGNGMTITDEARDEIARRAEAYARVEGLSAFGTIQAAVRFGSEWRVTP